MLTGEMIYKAFWMASLPENVHVTWIGISAADKARYTAMAAYLNTALIDNGAAERDARHLHAQINTLTDTVLRVEQERDAMRSHISQLADALVGVESERDAYQQLAAAHEVQAATPAPTAAMLLEQERADWRAQMREMGIPFQEGDNG